MINTSIKLTRNQVKECNYILQLLLSQYQYDIHYIDFYNVQSFCKKLFDRLFKMQRMYAAKPKRLVRITVNINEYQSISRIKELCIGVLIKAENVYYYTLLSEITDKCHKQVVSLPARHIFQAPMQKIS